MTSLADLVWEELRIPAIPRVVFFQGPNLPSHLQEGDLFSLTSDPRKYMQILFAFSREGNGGWEKGVIFRAHTARRWHMSVVAQTTLAGGLGERECEHTPN